MRHAVPIEPIPTDRLHAASAKERYGLDWSVWAIENETKDPDHPGRGKINIWFERHWDRDTGRPERIGFQVDREQFLAVFNKANGSQYWQDDIKLISMRDDVPGHSAVWFTDGGYACSCGPGIVYPQKVGEK